MDPYTASFGVAVLAAGLLNRHTQQQPNAEIEQLKTPQFVAFQRSWLTVYLLAFFADWLKGPYVYALYDSYGFDQGEIAMLFIVGFVSSMVVGTFVGGLADKYGRRTMCIMFSVAYFTAGVTKIFNHFWILMFGRFLSGVATSLLFSSFEAWMVRERQQWEASAVPRASCSNVHTQVSEHTSRGFDERLLPDTFAKATFGNGIVAVVAGLVASAAADAYGFVAPFLVCLVPLFLVGFIVSRTWSENYGNQKLEVMQTFESAWNFVRSDPKIMYLGAAQSSFEGAMYTFVFMWTPALATDETKATLPYGLIFAVFMVCLMIGSNVFTVLESRQGVTTLPYYIHGMAALLSVCTAMMIESKLIVYISFLLFEVACGIFFPTYGVLRSKHISEEARSAVMNLFRIPLNAFVVILLVYVKHLPVEYVFFICAAAHGCSYFCYNRFLALAQRPAPKTSAPV